MKGTKLLLCSGLGALALATAAQAQEANNQAEQADDAIVVTGTKLTTNGDRLPTPVTVVTPEALLKTSPTNIPDGLKKMPIFALSRGTATLNNATDNFTGNFLNLRGFGIQRNLILLDGHRVAPTSYTGAVDTNALPQMLMNRVDVVTGGASAVYGSDAVSGVVNFVLDKKFKGLKVDALSGISSRGDAFTWKFGAAYGTDLLGGRGHIEASYEHYKQEGLGDKFMRPTGKSVYAVAGAGTVANPFRLITDARAKNIAFDGLVLSGPRADSVFTLQSLLAPFSHGTAQGGNLESGGDGYYGVGSSITANLETDQAFARFDYDVADSINFFVQGSFSKANTSNNFYPNIIFPHTIAADNAFLPAATQAALGGVNFNFARVLNDPKHTIGVRSEGESWSISTGLNGSIGGFRWDLYYQHGQSKSKNTQVNNTRLDNLDAALDAVDQGLFQSGVANGNIVCRANLTNPGSHPGCVPLNLFGTNPESQAAALDYVFGNNYNQPLFKLDSAEASLAGTAFDNWAGPVKVAVSGAYREISLDVSTDTPSSLRANCTGIRFDCVAGTTLAWRIGQILPINVGENVKEIAGEVEFPLLKDSAIGSASLNGAIRYTDYSTSGGVTTWKIGGDWEPIDGLRFRATRSRDIRAPSLYDRFQPSTGATSGYQDLHTGVGGIVPTLTGGNPNLAPEVANTLTFGGVYRPSSVPGLSFAVDYYRIKINNAISSIDGRNSSIQRLCEDSNGTSVFCDLYVRPLPFSNTTAANAPSVVKIITLNASQVKTWGIDGEVNYSFSLGNDGRMTLRGLIGYQPELTTFLVPGATPLQGAGAAATQGIGGVPKLRMTAFIGYSTPTWSVDLQERWRSSLKWDANRTLVYAIPDVPSVAYTDLTFTKNIGQDKGKQIYLSVQNLFDKQPPVYLTSGTSGTPAFSFPAVSGDDVLGRFFTVGARFKF